MIPAEMAERFHRIQDAQARRRYAIRHQADEPPHERLNRLESTDQESLILMRRIWTCLAESGIRLRAVGEQLAALARDEQADATEIRLRVLRIAQTLGADPLDPEGWAE